MEGTVGLENYTSRAELKTRAKNLLRGRWKDAILLNIAPTLLTIAILIVAISAIALLNQQLSFSTSGNMNNYDVSYSENFSTGGGIISALITTGISFTFLDWLRNPEMRIRPLKNAFQIFTKKYFLRTVLIYILTSIFTFFWTLLFVIPGIIKSLAYSQAYFIYKDRTDHSENEKPSALDCITESRKMMNGHKWDYFLLQLSFIGWGLLSVLTFGIGFLWLNPYMNATMAAFYDDLSKNYYRTEQVEIF